MLYRATLYVSLVLCVTSSVAFADTATFDLAGPPVEVKVTRNGKSLPIANVPNLQSGDRIWIHPNLPDTQSVHYLLIAAFLRGPTNPPPDNWFFKAETWKKPFRDEGIVVTVPQDAQQALLFLAPETGGDFSTLRSAVQGKPGAFVRASQDLDQAGLDRSRLDAYLAGVRETSESDPKQLHDRSVLLARSLNIKIDQQCFDRPTEQQAPCLMQNTSQLVLEDGHSQSMVAALTSGPNSDLIGQIAYTRMAGGGIYSPYVGAVVDVARIFASYHTAQYQYIPALAIPKTYDLNLRLNNPPSFHNPKSVLVIGLPAVESEQFPPLRTVDPNQTFCLQQPGLVIPAEGAPLTFSTGFAHGMVLHLEDKDGFSLDLPATPDAGRGGFVIHTDELSPAKIPLMFNASLRGLWGFQSFTGPTIQMSRSHSANWMIPQDDRNSLIVGRDDAIHLQSSAAACVSGVSLKIPSQDPLKASWKPTKPHEVEVEVPLKDAPVGKATLLVKQYGLTALDEVSLDTYSESAHLDDFSISAGEEQGTLKGTRLDEVASLDMSGIHFVPAGLIRDDQKDELQLAAHVVSQDPLPQLHPEQDLVARVELKDGRVLDLKTKVEPPRPKLSLISKSVQAGATPSAIRLKNQDELPQDGTLSFFLKSEIPETFPRSEKIEVATKDGSFHTSLSLSNGGLILQDSQTIMATFDPLKSFGPSAFGPLRFRAIDSQGTVSAWQPLATLVRIPTLKEVRCPDTPDKQCTLVGSNLFLIDSVASDAQFSTAVPVPLGFVESELNVPRPNGTLLYLKLRDDPSTVNTAVLPVMPEQ
jgi:hypothetical protein